MVIIMIQSRDREPRKRRLPDKFGGEAIVARKKQTVPFPYAISDDAENPIKTYDAQDKRQIKQLEQDSKMKGKLIFEEMKPPVYVYKSKEGYGYGVAAKRNIKKGEFIGHYLGVKGKEKEKYTVE